MKGARGDPGDDLWLRVQEVVYRRCDVSMSTAGACADEIMSSDVRGSLAIADAVRTWKPGWPEMTEVVEAIYWLRAAGDTEEQP